MTSIERDFKINRTLLSRSDTRSLTETHEVESVLGLFIFDRGNVVSAPLARFQFQFCVLSSCFLLVHCIGWINNVQVSRMRTIMCACVCVYVCYCFRPDQKDSKRNPS